MQEFFEGFFGASGMSQPMGFPGSLVVGVMVGWLLARPCRISSWFASLALIGVCGAWLGGETAHLFGWAPKGGVEQFLAGMVGAAALAHAWRKWHPRPSEGDPDVAIHERHA
jgi:uncharacterized membrane protein YeaQ/YmgE (transglycosylase-associated protein family)